VGRPDLAARQLDEGGRGPVEELESLFATRTREAWAALGRERDLCITPVLEGDEPRRDPHLVARGVFATSAQGGAAPYLTTPVRVDGGSAPPRPAPELGADSDAVLAECGFTQREIAELRAGGVVGTPE
jgi:alpha-methylacyl-CoA racemase